MSRARRAAALTIGLALQLAAGCAVGPNYHRPATPSAPAYKESADWKPSQPSDALERGPWWQIYQDDTLNQLEAQIDISNQTVAQAAAQFAQAQALVAEARAGFWPTIAASFSAQRGQQGVPSAITNAGGVQVTAISRGNTSYTAGVTANWELDIWGKVRRTVESNKATAEQYAAALAAARLTAQSTFATDYFLLRVQDQLQQLLDDTVKAYQQSLKITESRYRFGVAARADVVTAQTQLLSAQAQQVNAKIERGTLEHALAVLLGKQPAEFSLERASLRSDVPTVPAGVPSALLERRPDVAEAERSMAAANAQIGIAKAAYFPTLTLGGQDEYSSSVFSQLIQMSNRVWAVGPTLAETIIDGGLRRAQVRAARATHDQATAFYRQTVLTGFQQVEDQIVTLRILEQQAVIEEATVKAAREAETLTLNQYKAGTVPYSSVITAQTTRLSSEQTALQVLSQRLEASVSLIAALGGGWDASMARVR